LTQVFQARHPESHPFEGLSFAVGSVSLGTIGWSLMTDDSATELEGGFNAPMSLGESPLPSSFPRHKILWPVLRDLSC
jgi:hypothetical protein